MDSPSQYTSSSEKERFEKQLSKDLARPSNKGKQNPTLSQSVLRKIKDETSQWARDIANQKLSQSNSVNNSATQAIPSHSKVDLGGSTSNNSDDAAGASIAGSTSSSSTNNLLPRGSNLGDILYWSPSAGNWVILASPSGSTLKVLASNGGVPFWNDTEDCED